MDELVEFVETHPAGVEAEDEEHTLDEIGLARPIWTYHTCEVAVEFTNHLSSCVRLEVLQHHVVDHQARLLLTRHVQTYPPRSLQLHCSLRLVLGREAVQASHALAAAVLLVHVQMFMKKSQRRQMTYIKSHPYT